MFKYISFLELHPYLPAKVCHRLNKSPCITEVRKCFKHHDTKQKPISKRFP